ncbi:hypothetical protein [Streptomyces canus]|uniref:hypothetical protein n=1 Tax=Streptomyces canus TaxID=58343 RepID=UPI0003638F38|nr:hypothetical protein [Streptomyces canus]
MDDELGPLVYSYTREEAFEDGALIEVPTGAAAAVGIETLIITAGARREFVAGDDGGEAGRLQTVLSAVVRAVKASPADEICFVVPAGELPSGQESTGADQLIAIMEPGESGEPVMTLMTPDEM